MKRLCVLFFCALLPTLCTACGNNGTVVCAESAIYFGSNDNYAVVIRQKYEGRLVDGVIKGKTMGYETEVVPITLYAEGYAPTVVFDENTDTVTLRYDNKEEALLLTSIKADKKVFSYFDKAITGEIRGKFLSGYGRVYYFCGYYEKEKLLYGVIFDENFLFLSSIGAI